MQKYFRGGSKEWFWIAAGIILLAAALILPLGCALAELSSEEQTLQKAFENNQIIRIHIIANSDSAEDQSIKLKVRDALIDQFGAMLANAENQDADSLYRMLVQNQQAMLETAKTSAKLHGFDGTITAETGLLHLPSRQYGSILLPEGEYRALRITIGEGKGQNWWCILYPQLCLALSQTPHSHNQQLLWDTKRVFEHWLMLK